MVSTGSSCACSGPSPELLVVSGQQMLGRQATTSQLLQLINAQSGRKQNRKNDTVKVVGSDLSLTALYNAVQEHGGSQQVSFTLVKAPVFQWGVAAALASISMACKGSQPCRWSRLLSLSRQDCLPLSLHA